jgi:hypothetical protein
MKIPKPLWDDKSLRDDIVVGVSPVKVAVLHRGRNAWHGVWAQHYIKNAELFTNTKDAKLGAEKLRERGNVFYVMELPALALNGLQHNLILVDPNSKMCFERFSGFRREVITTSRGAFADGIFPGCTMLDANNAVRNIAQNWEPGVTSDRLLLLGVTNSIAPTEPALDPYLGFQSSPQGSDYRLGWLTINNDYSNKQVNALAAEWNKLFGETTPEGFSESDLVLSKTAWISSFEKYLAELDRDRREKFVKLKQSTSGYLENQSKLIAAKSELANARRDRLKVGETYQEIRMQRERVEAAEESLELIESQLNELQKRLSDNQVAYSEVKKRHSRAITEYSQYAPN